MSGPVALETIQWGDGDRQILLLHGITSNAAGWWRVGPSLAERGWKVTAPDLRGHGSSPQPGTYLFAEHAADVLALGFGWDAVLGHSMGGAIAVLAAQQAPDWAAGLILQDPALVMPEPITDVITWLLDEYGHGADPSRVAADNPGWHPSDVAAKAAAIAASSAAMVRAIIEGNWPWNLLEEAASLAVPTVLLGSDPETGGILPVAVGDWLAQISGIEYRMLPGTSHSTHRESGRFDTYLSALVEALDRLPTLGREIH